MNHVPTASGLSQFNLRVDGFEFPRFSPKKPIGETLIFSCDRPLVILISIINGPKPAASLQIRVIGVIRGETRSKPSPGQRERSHESIWGRQALATSIL